MKVGDKIVCMDDVFVFDHHAPKEYREMITPKRGIEYTIRDLVDTGYGLGVRLVEIVNKRVRHDIGGNQEPVFMLTRFQKSSYDSVIERILTQFSPVEERLDCWSKKFICAR